jgi:hypothetical protein
MNMLYLPGGGSPSTTYSLSAPSPLIGRYLLLQFIDYNGKKFIVVLNQELDKFI